MTEGNGSAAIDRRQAILAGVGKLKTAPASMPDGDGNPVQVLVKELTGAQSKDFELAVERGTPTALGMLLQQSICDPETGKLLFEPADREALEQLGMGSALKGVLEVSMMLSGVTAADIAKAKDLLRRAPSTA